MIRHKSVLHWDPEEIALFIRDQGITMDWDTATDNPAWFHDLEFREEAFHYKVKLKKDRRSATFLYSIGRANTEPPYVVNVLDDLAADAASYENDNGDFDGWFDGTGAPEEERATMRKIFKSIERNAKKLAGLLGDEVYDRLLWEIQR